jgi:hypothetical protein
MQPRSLFKRAYHHFLGRVFAFAYFTGRRDFLGFSQSSWLKLATLFLLFAAWYWRWGMPAIIITFLLAVGLRLLYWRARRVGYNKFVPNTTAVMPTNNLKPLPVNQRLHLYASGTFAVSSYQDTVLLRPAEYWRVPLGDHVVMVHRAAETYLYQFFNAKTLQEVQPGWLLFGKHPLDTLAVTFLETWEPQHENEAIRFYVGGGQYTPDKYKRRTIYFSFDDKTQMTAVWHAIILDARQARETLAG